MEQKAKNELQKLLNCNINSIKIERLKGGMSNYTYVAYVDEKAYTVRIPGENAEFFVDRLIEADIVQKVNELDLSPKTHLLNTSSGVKIADFIKGHDLMNHNEIPYHEVSELLKKLHTANFALANDYQPLERLNNYEKIAKNTNNNLYDMTKKRWLKHYELELKNIRLVPCHCDAQLANFILTDDRLYLLDWEFAGNMDPIYDIACFGNVDFEVAQKLLTIYYGQDHTPMHTYRLYAWRAFQCLQWHNVAMAKAKMGMSDKLGVDFAKVSDMYLTKAINLLDELEQIKIN